MRLLDPEFTKKIDYLNIISRKVFRGTLKGEHRSKKKGVSPEFADYRNYVTGDDLRYIDWNLYGRLEKLFLKLFMEEEDLYVYLLLDNSRSMAWGNPQKLDYSIKLAAALGYIILNNMDRLSFVTINDRADFNIPPVRGKGQFLILIRELEKIKTGDTTNLNDSLKNFALKAPKAGLTIIISDFLDEKGYEEGLKFLFYKKFEPFIIQILSPQELNPLISGNVKLVDIETGGAKELTVNQKVIDYYKKNLEDFIEKLHNFCARRGAYHIISSTSVPFDRLILDTLKRGELVR